MIKAKSDILIILDIDETLVYATKQQLEKEHDFEVDQYFVYKRPYFDEFINYIDDNFNFAIWSSASDDYVDEITEKLKIKEKAEFTWARSKATFKRPSTFDSEGNLNIDSIDHHFFVKRLKKVKKLGYELEKILIVDDTPHKSQENYGNAIYISEFKGGHDDLELLKLMDYLDTLKGVKNVRTVEKRNWKEQMKTKL